MKLLALGLALALCLVAAPARACNPAIVTGVGTIAVPAPVVSANFLFLRGVAPVVTSPVVRNVVNVNNVAPAAAAPTFFERRQGGLRGLLFGNRTTIIR